MRKRRVAKRFYLFIALILLAAFWLFVRPHLNFGGEDVVFVWNSAYEQSMDCVIIRDETVEASDSIVHVEYVAKENTEIAEGDTVANLFTTGYSESLLSRLEETRQNIQAYHKTLLGTIVDNDLDRLETIIDLTAVDFKNLALRQTKGNLQTVVEQLETAMVNRQEYLRQNKRDDTKLTKLYDEENARLSSIQSWRKVSAAAEGGVVSFYLDGYEKDLSANLIDSLTAADVQTVLSGGELGHSADLKRTGIYRIVNQDQWYIALLTDANTWNPVVGQEYYLSMEGFEDLSYTAVVTSVQKESGAVLAVFEINQPIGPLIYQRTGRATMSISLSSIAVHAKSLYNENGQIGVWVYDVPGGTFVPVEVLSTDGDIALIQSLVDGALQAGQRLLVK